MISMQVCRRLGSKCLVKLFMASDTLLLVIPQPLKRQTWQIVIHPHYICYHTFNELYTVEPLLKDGHP